MYIRTGPERYRLGDERQGAGERGAKNRIYKPLGPQAL